MQQFNILPKHITIIMDGNGRWAKERDLDRVKGHIEGVKSVRAITEACCEFGIEYLSLYAFSEENWNRPAEEVEALMGLMLKSLRDEIDTLLKNGVRLRVLGNRARLSKTLNAAIDEVEKLTEANRTLTMIIFLSYSGKWDICQAARRCAEDFPSGDFTDKDLEDRLVTAGIPDPDLMIRTSGELRLSNYLLWQCAYTEFVFPDTLWPDFRKEELVAALKEYERRDRRYGKVK